MDGLSECWGILNVKDLIVRGKKICDMVAAWQANVTHAIDSIETAHRDVNLKLPQILDVLPLPLQILILNFYVKLSQTT